MSDRMTELFEALSVATKQAGVGPKDRFILPDKDIDAVRYLVALAVDNLRSYNKDHPSREASLALTKLEESLLWLHYRNIATEIEGIKEE